MSVLKTLQDRTLAERKAGGEHAAFLVMTLAEAGNLAKADSNAAVSDAHAGRAIRTALKQFRTLLEGDPETGTDPIPADSAYAAQVRAKRDLLMTIAPEPPTGEALAREIRAVADANDIPIEIKSMRLIMEKLNAKYAGQIDGKEVSELIRAGV